MEFPESAWSALIRHPSTDAHAIDGISARAQIGESGMGVFRYVLRADLSRVRIPPLELPERADGLWKHTCFEAFIKAPDAPAYYEFNVAPSRQWALYRFSAYRQGMSSPAIHAPPEISVRVFADRLEIDAEVRLRGLVGLQGRPMVKLALSAVVEEENGALSYWGLKHAAGEADFHDPQSLVLELALEGNP